MNAPLSARERQVLDLSAKGRIDKEVAAELGISLGTVRVYWKRLRTKYDGRTRNEILVAYGRGEAPGHPAPRADEDGTELLRRLTKAVYGVHELLDLDVPADPATDSVGWHDNGPMKTTFGQIREVRASLEAAADHLTRLGVSIDPTVSAPTPAAPEELP